MTKRIKRLALLLGFVLACPLVARAGFTEALTALQAKDYPAALTQARQTAEGGDARGSFLLGVIHQNGLGVAASATEAFAWYEKAAQGGVVGAHSKLAQLYARGDGVARNQEKAIAHARRGDQLNDPEASFFLYVTLNAGPLSFVDAAGKVDAAKYRRLATRPVADRLLDQEARDALYRASAKGYPLADLMLAMSLGATLGDGNRERMLVILARVPNHNNPALKSYERVARQMAQLGQTYTTPQLFLDTQASQTLAGLVATCGLRESREMGQLPRPELIAISIAKPLSGAVFLPSVMPGNERSYLVAGEWEENWTYRGCDTSGQVTVKFTADGMGGAAMVSAQSPKPGAVAPAKL